MLCYLGGADSNIKSSGQIWADRKRIGAKRSFTGN